MVTGWLHDAGWQNEHKGILYAAELKSEHPLALAIVEALKKEGEKPALIDSFESRTGRGIVVTRGNKTFWAGSHRLLKDFGAGISDLLKGWRIMRRVARVWFILAREIHCWRL